MSRLKYYSTISKQVTDTAQRSRLEFVDGWAARSAKEIAEGVWFTKYDRFPLNLFPGLRCQAIVRQMSEEGEPRPADQSSSIAFDDVIGTVRYKRPIPDTLVDKMVGHVFDFFIPITTFQTIARNTVSTNLVGVNVYPFQTPLTSIVFHQGVVVEGDDGEVSYWRVFNEYDDEWNMYNQVREPCKMAQVVGVEVVFRVIEKYARYEGAKQYNVRSHGSKIAANGIVFVFAQPVAIEPEMIRMKDLYGLGLEDELIGDDEHWLRFGLTGEAMNSYNRLEFVDDGLPRTQWLSMKLRKASVYFDTETDRYELALTRNAQSIVFSRLKQPLQCAAKVKMDGTPVVDTAKEVCQENIVWKDVQWDETGVTIRGEFYGPLLCYFWGRRKRPID